MFDLWVVVIVEVVQVDYGLVGFQQCVGGVGIDEVGSVGEQDGYGRGLGMKFRFLMLLVLE